MSSTCSSAASSLSCLLTDSLHTASQRPPNSSICSCSQWASAVLLLVRSLTERFRVLMHPARFPSSFWKAWGTNIPITFHFISLKNWPEYINLCYIHTLCLSMRLLTMSLSPPTGTSSASWGSARYNQSFNACRASVNLPENSSASSSLCCLQKRTTHTKHGLFYHEYMLFGCLS